uniref:RRM domain-containing protein n=1 Tax=Arcella intermedia TaxID=1963864 RepID=A0A6B2KYY0_9EUKA
MTGKPPPSARKVNVISKLAIKNLPYHKHVVQQIEKFVCTVSAPYRLSGLYLLDSILKIAESKIGKNNPYSERFAVNLIQTVENIFGCVDSDKPKAMRVITIWSEKHIFPADLLLKVDSLAKKLMAKHSEAIKIAEKEIERKKGNRRSSSDKKKKTESKTQEKPNIQQLINIQQSLSPQPVSSPLQGLPFTPQTYPQYSEPINTSLNNNSQPLPPRMDRPYLPMDMAQPFAPKDLVPPAGDNMYPPYPRPDFANPPFRPPFPSNSFVNPPFPQAPFPNYQGNYQQHNSFPPNQLQHPPTSPPQQPSVPPAPPFQPFSALPFTGFRDVRRPDPRLQDKFPEPPATTKEEYTQDQMYNPEEATKWTEPIITLPTTNNTPGAPNLNFIPQGGEFAQPKALWEGPLGQPPFFSPPFQGPGHSNHIQESKLNREDKKDKKPQVLFDYDDEDEDEERLAQLKKRREEEEKRRIEEEELAAQAEEAYSYSSFQEIVSFNPETHSSPLPTYEAPRHIPPVQPANPLPAPAPDPKGNDVVKIFSKTLFVGNLAPTVTYPMLSKIFTSYGKLTTLKYMDAKHFAFITYEEREDAEVAKKKTHGSVVEGRPMKVGWGRGFEGTKEQFDWDTGISIVPKGTTPGFRADSTNTYKATVADELPNPPKKKTTPTTSTLTDPGTVTPALSAPYSNTSARTQLE